jgi:glycerate dehydrogenase
MKFKKIVCLGYSGKEMNENYWSRIDTLSEERLIIANDDPQLDDYLKNADCLLLKLGAKLTAETINKCPSLKYIGMYGTGYGGIDIKSATDKGITVCNIADYATEGVAEFTFGTIISAFREFERAINQAKAGDYSEATFTGTEIKDKNFGVIGLGHIGTRTAEIAKAFGANVNYWSINKKEAFEYQEIDDLLKNSDIITINLSLNPETAGFLTKDRVQMIKKGALLVNPSPMELVDLDAIVERLKAGDITFVLDHSDEMTQEELEKLKPFKNCIIYPPIAYTTNEASALKKEIFIKNLENFLINSPTNKVN